MAIARGARGPKRPLNWYGAVNSTGLPRSLNAIDGAHRFACIAPLNVTAWTDDHESFIEELGEYTVTRLRGQLYVTCARSGTIENETLFVTMGIIMASFEAAATSAAALPNPRDDPEADWLWHYHSTLISRTVSLQYWNGSAAVSYNGQSDAELFERVIVDSRAQRKARKGELPVLCVQTEDGGGDPNGGSIAGMIRVLCRE